MIRSLEDLPPGLYVADYRGDEGIRIREDFICPTLTAHNGGGIGNEKLLIVVTDEDTKCD